MKKLLYCFALVLMLALVLSLSACSKKAESISSEDNASVSESQPVQEKKYIACIGDSITYGAGVMTAEETYPAYLQALVGDEYEVRNYGLNGRTLIKDADCPYTEEMYYKQSLELNADLCIIMLGSNDSRSFCWNADSYRSELADFVKAYQNTGAKVYLMQPTKCFNTSGYGISDKVIREEIYYIVSDVAEETGAGLIDLYTLSEPHSDWFPDTIHPNAEGNKAIAEEIYSALGLD